MQLNINRGLSVGSYLNPPSARFEKLKQTKVFVDKTGIFEILNENIKEFLVFICNSFSICRL